jgi:hypothetical protein
MCAECFSDGAVAPHRHSSLFVRIDAIGRHTVCSRLVSAAPVQQLLLSDFQPALDVQGCCQCCAEEFSADLPAVYSAFCRKRHGIPSTRDSNGKLCAAYDTRTFFCGTCALHWAREKGREFYDSPNLLCEVCVSETEMVKWRAEFEKEKREAEAEGNCEERARQLRDIHPQPWIQSLVHDVFAAS